MEKLGGIEFRIQLEIHGKKSGIDPINSKKGLVSFFGVGPLWGAMNNL